MTTNTFHPLLEIFCIANIFSQNKRSDKILENMQRRASRFVVIAWVACGNTFTITCEALGLQSDENALTIRLAPERSLERGNKRHREMMEGDGFNFHF